MLTKIISLRRRNLLVALALLMALGLIVGFDKRQSSAPQAQKPNTSAARPGLAPDLYVAEPGEIA